MDKQTADHLQQPSRRLLSATPAEQFSIWAMRTWWGAFPELDSAWPDLVAGFRDCGVAAAIESCHRFCSIALAAPGCGKGIGCLHCPYISVAEERLLEALAAAGSGDADAAEALLSRVLPARAAGLAAPHAVCFARILAYAGLSWPDRQFFGDERFTRLRLSEVLVNFDRIH